MAKTILLFGELFDDGLKCQGFRAENGEVYSLVGELGAVKNGDKVYVVGTVVDASICNRGQTLLVSWCGTKLAQAQRNTLLKREVEVTATYSSYDDSPEFKLEGRAQRLSYDNTRGKWYGRYSDFEIEPPLNILFVSEGWLNQSFELNIETRDSQGNSKSKKYTAVAKKGVAVIEEDMDV